MDASTGVDHEQPDVIAHCCFIWPINGLRIEQEAISLKAADASFSGIQFRNWKNRDHRPTLILSNLLLINILWYVCKTPRDFQCNSEVGLGGIL